jgi:hypothetical protein
MARRPVDLARVRRAMAGLDALAVAHPELIDREAAGEDNGAGWEATLRDLDDLDDSEDPDEEDPMPTEGIPVRVPPELLDRCAALVPALAEVPELRAAAGKMNRAAVLRLALLRGLDAMEAEYGGTKGGGRGKR